MSKATTETERHYHSNVQVLRRSGGYGDQEVVIEGREGTIRQDSTHPEYGMCFSLKMPTIDPETGTHLTREGDLAVDYRSMRGATINIAADGLITVHGFVEEPEMSGRYVHETWQQWNPDSKLLSDF